MSFAGYFLVRSLLSAFPAYLRTYSQFDLVWPPRHRTLTYSPGHLPRRLLLSSAEDFATLLLPTCVHPVAPRAR